jgi:hypothetical protein
VVLGLNSTPDLRTVGDGTSHQRALVHRVYQYTGVEVEACDRWEWFTVEVMWGLAVYSNVVSQQVIRGPSLPYSGNRIRLAMVLSV